MTSSENILGTLLAKGSVIILEPNHFLLRSGNVSEEVYFIREGVVRHFVIDQFEKEKTIRISSENDFFYSSIVSYYTGEPTYINCETLTECKLVKWNKSLLEQLFAESKELDMFRYQQLTQFIIEKHKKEISLLTQSADQRYEDFFSEHGNLFNRIPHHIIATYLNMTPETLSRIRRRSIS